MWLSGVSCELALKAEYEVEPDGDIQRATHVIPGDEPQKSKWNPCIKKCFRKSKYLQIHLVRAVHANAQKHFQKIKYLTLIYLNGNVMVCVGILDVWFNYVATVNK